MADAWAGVLGELRQLAYEWRFRRSQWAASAQNMALFQEYADKAAGDARLSYQQTLRAEAAARDMLEDVRHLGAAVRAIEELRARVAQMDRAGEPDPIHRVAGVTAEYAALAVDQHWRAAADDYRRLARLARGVLHGTVALGAVAAAAPPPPAIESDFEERLLLVARAAQVQAARAEERRLGIRAVPAAGRSG
ncbi:hypothetical protein H4R18_000240 [Coemansia javaensis]|uniref:Uncharacterized protein n=1 Tax=Coemansia javaensis TaxID=2761396 RepID=A0A9W8HLN8_9FUNG|nr:hypothetical protein H4R18_000240 [Coemansia javaensis]